MVKQPRFILPQLLSLPAHKVTYTLQDILVDRFCDCQALWQELSLTDALHIEERDQHDLWLWPLLYRFHRPRRRRRFPLIALSLVSRTYPKIHVLSPMTTRLVGKRSTILEFTSMWALLLIILQQSWHHFSADLPHSQIFGDDHSNSVLFPVQLTSDQSTCQQTIAVNILPYIIVNQNSSLLKASRFMYKCFFVCACVRAYVCVCVCM